MANIELASLLVYSYPDRYLDAAEMLAKHLHDGTRPGDLSRVQSKNVGDVPLGRIPIHCVAVWDMHLQDGDYDQWVHCTKHVIYYDEHRIPKWDDHKPVWTHKLNSSRSDVQGGLPLEATRPFGMSTLLFSIWTAFSERNTPSPIMPNGFDPGASYAGTVIAACGVFPTVAVAIAWAGNNAGGELKRGVVLAMTIGFGNLGGIVSSFIYRTQDSPRFHLGHGVVIGVLCMSWVASAIAFLVYRRLNSQKDELCARENIVDCEERRAEYRDLGDASPLFRYTL
ncbi:transmembrane protein, putative, partial [Rhizoctonia solani AG-3 Rhs1AP]